MTLYSFFVDVVARQIVNIENTRLYPDNNGGFVCPHLIQIRQDMLLKSTLKNMERKWKCSNSVFLDSFLYQNYNDIDIDNPTYSITIDDQTTKLVFNTNNVRKIIYRRVDINSVEYYTKSSWFLFSLTKNYKKVVCNHIVLYYDQQFDDLGSIEFIENYIDTISNLLLINSCVEIEIYLIPQKAFRTLFNSDDVTGFFDPLKGKIYLDKLDHHATHEIIHRLIDTWGIYPNLFCSEGIAECFKKPIEIPDKYIENIKLFADIFFDRDEINRERYGVAGLFFRYIYTQYGILTVWKICKNSYGSNCEQTEKIIKEETGNDSIVYSFVEWFGLLDLNKQDWYFQNNYKRNV